MHVAVLGTGIMGAPMARNLARAGHEVRAYNRTRDKAQPLAADGIAVVDTPTEAVVGADVVLTMLSDADAVLAVAEQLPAGDAIWWQASTIGIEGIERCAVLAAGRGLTLVDGPVAGTRQPAEQGQLTVFAAGPEPALDTLAPLFDAVGSATLRLGEVGAGTRMKLVFNHWLIGLVETLAETIALAEAIDVDPRQFLDAVSKSPLGAPYAAVKGPAMVERSFEPSFPLSLAEKDAGLVLEAAERHGLDLGVVAVARERMQRAIERGHGDDDMAAVIRGTVDD
jgi:3-hydroxyisobutyrate dehydrogenase